MRWPSYHNDHSSPRPGAATRSPLPFPGPPILFFCSHTTHYSTVTLTPIYCTQTYLYPPSNAPPANELHTTRLHTLPTPSRSRSIIVSSFVCQGIRDHAHCPHRTGRFFTFSFSFTSAPLHSRGRGGSHHCAGSGRLRVMECALISGGLTSHVFVRKPSPLDAHVLLGSRLGMV
jgi:hypothetical protein